MGERECRGISLTTSNKERTTLSRTSLIAGCGFPLLHWAGPL